MPSGRIRIETLSLNTFNMSAAGFRRSLALCILLAALCDGGKPKHTKPDVTIVFNRENAVYDIKHLIYRVGITCTVLTDDQTSIISLVYVGPDHNEVEVSDKDNKRTETPGDTYKYLITEHQGMSVPSEGYIRCAARGDSDAHEVTEPVMPYSTGCPNNVTIELRQNKLGRRQSRMVKITAEITGILRHDIQHLLFLLKPSNSLLYEFSVIRKEENIGDKPLVVKQENTSLPKGFKHEFLLNLTLLHFYSVEVQIDVSNVLCLQSLAISFEDPELTLSIDGITKRNDVTDIVCIINEAAGEPFFSIRYEGAGSEHFTELLHNRSVEELEDHYRGVYMAIVRVPDSGVITCEVRDGLGSYITTRQIRIQDSKLTSSQNGFNVNRKVLFYVAFAFSGICLGYTFFILVRNRFRKTQPKRNIGGNVEETESPAALSNDKRSESAPSLLVFPTDERM